MTFKDIFVWRGCSTLVTLALMRCVKIDSLTHSLTHSLTSNFAHSNTASANQITGKEAGSHMVNF